MHLKNKSYMRKVFFILLVFYSAIGYSEDCVFVKDGKTIPLYGKVQIVESFPDIKVQIVDAFADLNVVIVSFSPDECGEVQLVEAFPDVKVQLVDAHPDIKVKIVKAFPGMTDINKSVDNSIIVSANK